MGKYPSEEALEIQEGLLTAVGVLLCVECSAVDREVCELTLAMWLLEPTLTLNRCLREAAAACAQSLGDGRSNGSKTAHFYNIYSLASGSQKKLWVLWK